MDVTRYATCTHCGFQTTEEDIINGGGGDCFAFFMSDKPLNRADVRALVNAPINTVYRIVGFIGDTFCVEVEPQVGKES